MPVMKQILSLMFALAFILSGVVGHTSMVVDGSEMGHSAHAMHATEHVGDGAPTPANQEKAGACAAACAVAWGFAPPLFLLRPLASELEQPVVPMRLALAGSTLAFDPPPPKA
jgi:hypothetical protein